MTQKAVSDKIFSLLNSDSALSALLAGGSGIAFGWPPKTMVAPMVTWYLLNGADSNWTDDAPGAITLHISIDIWCAEGVDSNPIADRIRWIFENVYFSVDMCLDVPEPDTRFTHKHIDVSGAWRTEDI
jgi:hypothetical protein